MERFWITLPHPFSIYEISHSDSNAVRETYEPLVKEGLPSFPSLIAAAYYYVFGMEHRPGTRIPGTLTFCIGHRECWLEKIHLRSSSIKVEINGIKVKGARLEIRAGMKHCETILQKSGSKTVSLPEGLPESIWIALTRGDSWLDYRKLDLRSGYLLPEEKVAQEPEDKPT